VVVEAEHH